MKKVWIASQYNVFDILNWKSFLILTNSRKIKFGDKFYVNKNGYGTIRKTKDFIGWIIKDSWNLNAFEHPFLLDKLSKLLHKKILKGEEIW